jgi:hypothetical protein
LGSSTLLQDADLAVLAEDAILKLKNLRKELAVFENKHFQMRNG